MTKKRIFVILGVAAALLVAFVLVYFEPQALLINKKSNQSQKGEIIARSSTTVPTDPTPASLLTTTTTLPSKSMWTSREHTTTGEVFLTRNAEGGTYVRFENLDTDNGPDLKVYIAKSINSNGEPGEFSDLGPLVANRGNANYLVPDTLDINEYSHVIIWCKRFSVSFADATI